MKHHLHKPESQAKVFYETKIEELEHVKHYLEERLVIVQDIHEGAVKLGDKSELVDATATEAARLVQMIKTMDNHIEIAQCEMKRAH